MSSPAFNLQIRPEYYASLTLESLTGALVQAAATPNALLRPPLQQPFLDIGQSQIPLSDTASLVKATSAAKGSKPWLRWFQDVYSLVTAAAPTPDSQFIEVLGPSIDETDDGWYGTGTIAATTDPISITITLVGVTRFGIACTITASGTGYTSAPVFTIASSNGNGQPALGTGILDGTAVVGFVQTTQGYDLQAPLVVTITGGAGSGATATAILGRQFAAGDFIVWNDPTKVTNAYSYEIDQISQITPINNTSFTAKITRAADGAAAGTAQYGSLLNNHAAGTQLFRLINKSWVFPVDTAAGPQVIPMLWANMCVVALAIGQQGQQTFTVNLAPPAVWGTTTDPPPRLSPPAPGLRTMNGAAYTNLGFPSLVSLSTVSQSRVSVQAWESIRTVYAKVGTAPTGPVTFMGNTNACVVIYICYISPAGVVGLIDTLVINDSAFNSYSASNPPDGRQMPFHFYFPAIAPNKDFPPNVLPVLTGALTGAGVLQLGFTVSTTDVVEFSPDGQIDFIVAQIGTTIAGGGPLVVTVQT